MNAELERFQLALAALQKPFGEGLERVLPGILQKLDEHLFDLGEASTDSELQTLYHQLRTTVQDERQHILAHFRQTLQNCMAKLDGSPAAAADAPFNLQTLSLVEFDEMEESLGINGLSQRLNETCADELAALSSGLKRIRGTSTLTDKDNPFSPEMISQAMGKSFSMVEGVRPKLLLFKTLAEPLRDPLKTLYRDLNETMATQGFELSAATIVKAASRPAPVGGSPVATSQTAPQPLPGSSPAVPQAVFGQSAAADDLFAILQQLIRPAGAAMPAGTAAPAEGFPALGFPALTSGATAPLATPELLSTLSQIQHAIPRGELPVEGTARADATAAFSTAELTAGLTNVLHHIRQTPTYTSASQADAITIDVVAMMFDFIFDDDDIPPAVKGLIGRLQIPVLKAAMLDKKFFSKKDNPARKLLDRTAHAAIGWKSEIDTQDPLYRKLDELIRHIVDKFEDNSDIFSQATAQLDEFLQLEEMRAEARSRAVTEEIRKRELKESAPEIAHQQIEKRCQDARCTPMLQEFLRHYWVTPLADAYAVNGADSPEWASACRSTEDLFWSVEPKTAAEERAQLLKRLPALLQTLSEAMEQQQAPVEFSTALFAHLVEVHTAALKGLARISTRPAPQAKQTEAPGEPAEPAAAPARADPSAIPQARPKSANELPAGGEIDTSEMYSGDVQVVAPDVPEGDEFDRIAHTIAKGTWVEFKLDKSDSIRCRLLWTSPLRGSHLFSSRDGGNAIKISPSGLASRLRKGKAIILQDQPLVDRVVDNVLSRLKKSQASTT